MGVGARRHRPAAAGRSGLETALLLAVRRPAQSPRLDLLDTAPDSLEVHLQQVKEEQQGRQPQRRRHPKHEGLHDSWGTPIRARGRCWRPVSGGPVAGSKWKCDRAVGGPAAGPAVGLETVGGGAGAKIKTGRVANRASGRERRTRCLCALSSRPHIGALSADRHPAAGAYMVAVEHQ